MDELYAPGVPESVLECTTERGRVVCVYVCVCVGCVCVCVWGCVGCVCVYLWGVCGVCVCGGEVWGVCVGCVWEGAQVQDIVLLECFASIIMQTFQFTIKLHNLNE